MATQPQNPEAGVRRHRLGFAREDEFGVTGDDPEFLKYSKAFSNFNWSSGSTIERVSSAGTVDPVDQEKGPEEHEVTATYALCRGFTDGAGNANDAAYDGLVRDVDNLLPNSHTVVDRVERARVVGEATHNGNTARPSRTYVVGKGGLIDEVSVTGDPSDAQPIQVELTYAFQYVRPYQFDQPTADEGTVLIAVASTDPADDTQTVTVESEDGATSATYNLDGDTLVTDATEFSDIDAVELDEETQGNVEIYINEGDDTNATQGDLLGVLNGANAYDDVEGDLGVPTLGGGSREDVATLGDYEKFIGDTILRDDDPVPHEIPNATLTVANNVEQTERGSGFGMALHPGNREVTLEASMYGERATYDSLQYHLQNLEKDHAWVMDNDTLVLEGAHLTEPGEVAAEEENAVLILENTFRMNDLSFA